ncbi:hypothetical protein P13BB106kb_p018 [Pectobacterium phage DU_PP_V]|uniref:Uncharacterized protein n=1 Tax=Pectobacterium phage DU_PP_V TaxID=2041492 RepID=A0A2D2W6S9_9CAUD|nr:hypothetical protein HOS40_gp018 [Pectobacterium phage DU_PP_V]ATS94002.1 hypothetical protein P13BB106kb_p018 [Pectobacterium phage DU_PP_V]
MDLVESQDILSHALQVSKKDFVASILQEASDLEWLRDSMQGVPLLPEEQQMDYVMLTITRYMSLRLEQSKKTREDYEYSLALLENAVKHSNPEYKKLMH